MTQFYLAGCTRYGDLCGLPRAGFICVANQVKCRKLWREARLARMKIWMARAIISRHNRQYDDERKS